MLLVSDVHQSDVCQPNPTPLTATTLSYDGLWGDMSLASLGGEYVRAWTAHVEPTQHSEAAPTIMHEEREDALQVAADIGGVLDADRVPLATRDPKSTQLELGPRTPTEGLSSFEAPVEAGGISSELRHNYDEDNISHPIEPTRITGALLENVTADLKPSPQIDEVKRNALQEDHHPVLRLAAASKVIARREKDVLRQAVQRTLQGYCRDVDVELQGVQSSLGVLRTEMAHMMIDTLEGPSGAYIPQHSVNGDRRPPLLPAEHSPSFSSVQEAIRIQSPLQDQLHRHTVTNSTVQISRLDEGDHGAAMSVYGATSTHADTYAASNLAKALSELVDAQRHMQDAMVQGYRKHDLQIEAGCDMLEDVATSTILSYQKLAQHSEEQARDGSPLPELPPSIEQEASKQLVSSQVNFGSYLAW